MYSRETTILNKTGLHARPASDFVQCASKFESEIMVKKKDSDNGVDAKSILNILISGFVQGTEIVLEANGPDEVAAVDALVGLVESRFGEE